MFQVLILTHFFGLDKQEEQEKITHPYTVVTNHEHKKQKPLFTTSQSTQNQPFKSVCIVPAVSKSKLKQNIALAKPDENPTAVKLLQKPLEKESFAMLENKQNNTSFKEKSVHGDRTPPSRSPIFPYQESTKDKLTTFTPLSKSQQSYATPKHFNRTASSHNTPTLENNENEDLKRPKVAACMKLLDPSKGKYEPRVSIVYKPTPSVSGNLNQKGQRPYYQR